MRLSRHLLKKRKELNFFLRIGCARSVIPERCLHSTINPNKREISISSFKKTKRKNFTYIIL